jgi:uncharacterized protein involved in exopolysaccharide biosynthesis
MQPSDLQEESPYYITNLVTNIKARFSFLWLHWKLLFVMGTLGGLLGVGYSVIKKDTYTAATTFVVEDNKSSGGGIASALAGQFGIDLGGLSGGSGVLQGDNVLELLKSKSLLKKALLTSYDSSGKMTLADAYASAYGYTNKWANSKEVGRMVNFSSKKGVFTRLEDSLLHVILKRITEKELSIAKPDKKLSLFSLEITTRDEQLSQLLCQRLLTVTTGFYIDTKTKRVRGNVERLQQRVDSIKAVLNNKTYTAISANRELLDANPAFSQGGEMQVEVTGRDKMVQAAIFGELTKNLEASKTALLQETPTIQVVDTPEMPLKKNEINWLLALIIGAAVATFITALYLFIKGDKL